MARRKTNNRKDGACDLKRKEYFPVICLLLAVSYIFSKPPDRRAGYLDRSFYYFLFGIAPISLPLYLIGLIV